VVCPPSATTSRPSRILKQCVLTDSPLACEPRPVHYASTNYNIVGLRTRTPPLLNTGVLRQRPYSRRPVPLPIGLKRVTSFVQAQGL
jgi:hypothetical protein